MHVTERTWWSGRGRCFLKLVQWFLHKVFGTSSYEKIVEVERILCLAPHLCVPCIMQVLLDNYLQNYGQDLRKFKDVNVRMSGVLAETPIPYVSTFY